MGLFFNIENHYYNYMDNKLSLFLELANLYQKNGYSLYMVGGSVRDYLLNIPLTDMDLVTDATPIEEKAFLDNADYTFERFGSVKLKYQGVKFDITTLRKEDGYNDSRHPNVVTFTKDIKEDYLRRDITINALYLSSDLKVIDYVSGVEDLNNRLIKMVGDPSLRIKEDPLRIIRIYRFAIDLDFKIDEGLLKIINENKDLLSKLRKEKIIEEIHKCHHQDKLRKILEQLGINNL